MDVNFNTMDNLILLLWDVNHLIENLSVGKNFFSDIKQKVFNGIKAVLNVRLTN